MLNFEFYSPTRLIVGKGTADQIGAHIAPLAQKVLVHYGSDRVVKNGLLKRVTDSLSASGVSYVTLGGVIPNPDVELVREGIALAKKENVELVLCVGGGSVIDSGKGIGAGTENPDPRYLGNLRKAAGDQGIVPCCVLLTFPAADRRQQQHRIEQLQNAQEVRVQSRMESSGAFRDRSDAV
jgi:alcohol dehydrogenase YqhD (iron-dependent ADH family)